jgi:hypothetical protein
MRASEAREIATKFQESGAQKILEDIKKQALKGGYGLSVTDYRALNEPCRKILNELGYSVKWQGTQRDDGYWQITW